jgi:glycosyltransferase involved in cell wall biosynthesis
MKTCFKRLLASIDCLVAAVAVIGCFLAYLLFWPWVLRRRKRWASTAKGHPNVLLIHGFNVQEFQKRGYEFLLPFRNRWIKWTGIFDPINTLNRDIHVTDDLSLVARKLPNPIEVLARIGFKATATIFREFYSVYRIADLCVKEKIGVLRAYKHNFPALRIYLASRLIGIPFIIDITGNYELIRRLNGKPFYFRQLMKVPLLGRLAPSLTNWLLGVPLKHADYVLGRNKNNYEHAFALGADVEKMSLLRVSNFNSAFNTFDPAKLPPRPLEAPYALFVARMVEIKFPFDVIDAFELAAQKLPDYRLVMIGDGSCRRELESRIAASPVGTRIMFLGAVSSETVFSWTAHASQSICPFSGYTLAESMLCGVPVIAYDVENHAEVIIDGYTGFLVPFRNVKELSQAMVVAAKDHEKSRSIGLRAQELARVAFDKDKIMLMEGRIYRQLLGMPADAREMSSEKAEMQAGKV